MATTAERYRTYEGIALFSMGFRPFFLAAGLFATLSLPLWIAAYSGWLPGLDRDWHVHEMLFGYLGSVIAGFLLTAIPNWTGRLPVTGTPLIVLFSLWCIGRAAMLAALQNPIAAFLDSLFLIALACFVTREVIAGKNARNLPVCVIVALFAAANILTHLRPVDPDLAALGERGALALVAMLLALIGGRITPSFTRNWLAKRQSAHLPAPVGPFDVIVLAVSAASLLSWVAFPEHGLVGILLALAGLLNALRLLRWRGWLTGSEPLVLILHTGYAWLAGALLLLGAHGLAADIVPRTAGVHALTAGAFGVMTLAVMTRATRGHTGQPLIADGATQLVYGLVNAGAVLRVSAPFFPAHSTLLLIAAAFFWSVAFLAFTLRYAPLLLRPRQTV